MAVGATNLVTTLVSGNPLASALVNDAVALLGRVDDEVLYDLVALDPPASASTTNVNVGYIPVTTGTHVTAGAGSRIVTVAPTRFFRSSTSNATPRRMISAVNDAGVIVTLPTAPGAGLTRVDLLSARISYVNAAEPAKGTQVAFEWASGATATIPATPAAPSPGAHTSTSWVVPVAYVVNSSADAYVPQVNITAVSGINANSHVMNARTHVARTQAIETSRGAASGIATLNASTQVVQRLAYEAAASGVPTLNGSSQVVQRLAYEGAASGVATLNGSSRVNQLLVTPTVTQMNYGSTSLGTVSLAQQIPLTIGGTGVAGDIAVLIAQITTDGMVSPNYFRMERQMSGQATEIISMLPTGDEVALFSVFTVPATGSYTVYIYAGIGSGGPSFDILTGRYLVLNIRP